MNENNLEKKKFFIRFAEIAKQLKVPKENKNSFGNYNYRNAEDILSALKDCLKQEEGECVYLTSKIVFVEGRFYVEAVAIFTNGEFEVSAPAFAREEETKKGMDASQITGSATSYARKYALAGLFGIDNEKDADSEDNSKKPSENVKKDFKIDYTNLVLNHNIIDIKRYIKDDKKFDYIEFDKKLDNNKNFTLYLYQTKDGYIYFTVKKEIINGNEKRLDVKVKANLDLIHTNENTKQLIIKELQEEVRKLARIEK